MIMLFTKRNSTNELELWNRDFPVSRTIDRLQRKMDSAFDDFFRGDLSDTSTLPSKTWIPAVDVAETSVAYVIHAELPGVKKDEVKITVHDNLITIRGEKKSEVDNKAENVRWIEQSYGMFERSFSFPGAVKSDGIEARYDDGVLTIILPKTEEAKEKTIDVKVK